ncbi:reprolysin-like metallopeptidase [Pseudoalteromonas sp. T1lg23B]|uniref:reprolysin-like metallopeptidase n=1 Tax=Pseudoalteromonas sp. T1lg23B TaxID=2077097 RepID=UPI00131A1197|nr:zinc-dependent metalloprotease family protein [Pseudoalteromonas sp. T1lg23B]
MNRSLLLLCSFFVSITSYANSWQWQTTQVHAQGESKSAIGQHYSVNHQKLTSDLIALAEKGANMTIALPDGSGGLLEYVIRYDPIMAPALAQKYPMIRSFSGHQVGVAQNTGRFDIGPNGFYAFYQTDERVLYVDPSYGNYKVYEKGNRDAPWHDEVVALQSDMPLNTLQQRGPLIGNGGTVEMVTYRLAVTTSDEYTSYFGGKTQALNGIVTTINRVNQIYQTDIAVRLELVANNDALIFTENDPYDNGELDDTLTEVQNQIDTIIGSSNYDVGHLMATSGAGLAALGVICDDSGKAMGMTGIGTPEGDAFDVDYVAHELGHQFGANHTYNGSAGSCSTRVSNAAYEPGSGITIMAYAGICGSENLDSNSIAMFHSYSIDEIHSHLTQGSGATCGSLQDDGNKAPVADAKADHVIPINTPFMLTGSATDANSNDTLTYSWEQLDLGSPTSSAEDLKDNGEGPMFRPYLPSTSATRYFPLLADVISGQVTKGDGYPTTDRTMTFRLVVRDGNGGVSFDTASVTTVSAAGPFVITAPDQSSSADENNQITVSWNVAGTNQAPVSCANVDIMQTNSDASQSQLLLSGTPNDGQQQVTLIGSQDNKARVMVMCATSIFYALSPEFDLSPSLAVTSQQTISTAEDTSVTLEASQFSVVNQQADSQLALSVIAGTNYTFSGNTIMPAANFNGELTVNITLTDGTTTTSYPAKIQVTPVNDAPEVLTQVALTMNEDQTITLAVSQFEVLDVDSSEFTLTILAGEQYTFNANVVSPDANFNGLLEVPLQSVISKVLVPTLQHKLQ